MNCQLCQNELDAYREGRLSGDMLTQVEAHLGICADCTEIYRIELLADSILEREKGISPDKSLSARIMAQIENPEEIGHSVPSKFAGIFRPVLVLATMAAAIFAGVLIGDIYKPSEKITTVPVELALIDDTSIESLNILSIQ